MVLVGHVVKSVEPSCLDDGSVSAPFFGMDRYFDPRCEQTTILVSL